MTRELLQQALEALDTCSTLTTRQWFSEDRVDAAREALQAHLTKPAGKPERKPMTEAERLEIIALREQMAADRKQALIWRDEVERLTACLAKANSQAEHFEREWCLRGDEVERPLDLYDPAIDGQAVEIAALKAEIEAAERQAEIMSDALHLARLERKPMHEGEIKAAWAGQDLDEPIPYTFVLGIRSAERFNGIKETP